MSPDLLNGDYNPGSNDIWSLGIIFDELLHGKSFYSDTTINKIFNRINKIEYFVRDKSISQ